MADNLRLDSHKLIYHPETVARWMKGENIYPIEIEISPSGACNHRCIFCALDYIGYEPVFLDKDVIIRDIRHMASKGLKSVICSGEGEPLLNKNLSKIIKGIREIGVDVAMASNGVLLTKEFVDECLGDLTWIRFSIASTELDSYSKIHRGKSGDLEMVKKNLAYAVQYKKNHNCQTTLGVQCLLIQDNFSQIVKQAKELREIGVDYFTIKPYSQHLHSKNHLQVDYNELLDLEREIRQYETANFRIYYRTNAMQKMHKDKQYKQCLGLPFMTYIDSRGNVWPCCAHIGTNMFLYGNIYEHTFEEIWEGQQRKEAVLKLNSMDINKVCREACRLDDINIYLDELMHPGEHVNFI